MNQISESNKIGQAILDVISSDSKNTKFQILNPAINWNWTSTVTGVISREQYEFCDRQPQSCQPNVEFARSSNSFSDNYRVFLDALDPDFEPPQILQASKLKLVPPKTSPADTLHVPDGWTKVPDGSGMLRWRLDWGTSVNPNDWIARTKTKSSSSGTINLTSLVSQDSDSIDQNQILQYRRGQEDWRSISIQNGEVENIEIYSEAFDRIEIQPGAWYSSGILGLGTNGPFVGDYQSSTFFGKQGILGCRISEFVVAYKPQLTLDVSNSLIRRHQEDLSNADELKIAGFVFKRSSGKNILQLEKSKSIGNRNRCSAQLDSAHPQIIGVFIEGFDAFKGALSFTKEIKFGDKFYLIHQNGEYIIGAQQTIQYFPRLGNTGQVALEFAGGIGNVSHGMTVQIKSTEEFLGKFNVLGTWSTPSCYYYSTDKTYQQQNWRIEKKNKIDIENEQIRDGDTVYLSNIYYKAQKLVKDARYLTTKKNTDEYWIIKKIPRQAI